MRRTAAEKKEALVSDLVEARSSILALVRSLTSAQREEACVGSWTIMEVLAHLAGWDHTNRQAVEEIAAGQRPGFFQFYDTDWRSYNARLVAQYREETLDAMIAAVEGSHRALIETLRSMEPAAILHGRSDPSQGRVITIRNLLTAEAGDERKHAEQIQAHFEEALARSNPR